MLRTNRPQTVHRFAESVDHPAEQFRPRLHAGVFLAGDNRIAQVQPVGFLQRHRQHSTIAKSDHLSANHAAVLGADFAEIADSGGGAVRFHQQTHQFGDAAGPSAGLDRGQLFMIRSEVHSDPFDNIGKAALDF